MRPDKEAEAARIAFARAMRRLLATDTSKYQIVAERDLPDFILSMPQFPFLETIVKEWQDPACLKVLGNAASSPDALDLRTHVGRALLADTVRSLLRQLVVDSRSPTAKQKDLMGILMDLVRWVDARLEESDVAWPSPSTRVNKMDEEVNVENDNDGNTKDKTQGDNTKDVKNEEKESTPTAGAAVGGGGLEKHDLENSNMPTPILTYAQSPTIPDLNSFQKPENKIVDDSVDLNEESRLEGSARVLPFVGESGTPKIQQQQQVDAKSGTTASTDNKKNDEKQSENKEKEEEEEEDNLHFNHEINEMKYSYR